MCRGCTGGFVPETPEGILLMIAVVILELAFCAVSDKPTRKEEKDQ